MKIVYSPSLKVECLTSNLWIRQISVLYGRYFRRLFVSMFFNIKLHLTSGNNVELCCCKSFGSARLRLIVYHKVFMTSIAIMQQSCIDYCIIITSILMVCIRRHGGHVGGTTQRNMLLILLSDPAGVGG